MVNPEGREATATSDITSNTPGSLPTSDDKPSFDLSTRSSNEVEVDTSSNSSSPRVIQDTDTHDLRISQEQCRSDKEATGPSRPPESSEAQSSLRDVNLENPGEDTETQISPETPSLELSTKESTDFEAAMAKLQADHEAAELRWQEELHDYVEKIDTLQSKLKYLAKEAADSAKNAMATAASGTLEKKLTEKDLQIATLMEEGQKLSKFELEHRTTIKKLRQHIVENNKSLSDTKRKLEAVEKDLANSEERARRLELAERRTMAKLDAQSGMKKDLEAVTLQRDDHAATVRDLKSQLERALARAEAAERRVKIEFAQNESRQVADLKNDLANAKVEREQSEEKLRQEIRTLKEGIDHEKERARLLEVELRREQSAMESKMETLRVRAEEVSSGVTGDAQAKLLRQIETLQTQYAVASENWRGIESSLLSRLANVEKERDEIARKEGDLRRRAREAVSVDCALPLWMSLLILLKQNLKSKRAEGELENSREVIQELERTIDETKGELEQVSSKLRKVEAELECVKQHFGRQKEALEATWMQRLDDEKMKWQEQNMQSGRLLSSRTESPIALSRKSEALTTVHERPGSHRSAGLPIPFSGIDTPPRQNSYSSYSSNAAFRASSNDLSGPSIDIPSAPFDSEDYFNGVLTPATPSAQGAHSHPARGINDIISVSTIGAGPSVQLVERMSATVRRLENERAGLKDELARLTTQRDEARQEVVELLREVEAKRVSDQRVKELEESIEQLDQRYQTTLEMLGEKSEQVEEQKADIEDLKKISRELIESMVR